MYQAFSLCVFLPMKHRNGHSLD